jgi:hypothetical protein
MLNSLQLARLPLQLAILTTAMPLHYCFNCDADNMHATTARGPQQCTAAMLSLTVAVTTVLTLTAAAVAAAPQTIQTLCCRGCACATQQQAGSHTAQQQLQG